MYDIITVNPTISLSGSNAQSMVDAYCEARAKVNEAIEAICKIDFNARDYAAADFEKAKAERKETLDGLRHAASYLESKAIGFSRIIRK